jgi:hypothetical protein
MKNAEAIFESLCNAAYNLAIGAKRIGDWLPPVDGGGPEIDEAVKISMISAAILFGDIAVSLHRMANAEEASSAVMVESEKRYQREQARIRALHEIDGEHLSPSNMTDEEFSVYLRLYKAQHADDEADGPKPVETFHDPANYTVMTGHDK